MKKLLLFSLIFFTLSVEAQVEKRQSIKGKINVGPDGSADGINISNLTSGKGTYTDEYGRFSIPVQIDDKLVFTSIQYEQFTVIVTKELIKKGKMDITLHEGNTELKEIVIKPDLTGDISLDVRKIKTQNANLPTTQEMMDTEGYKFRRDKLSKVDNDAIDKGYLRNGLNFANIFRTIFKSKDKNKNIHKDVDVEIRKVYNDDFFRQNLNIDRNHINDFIFYAQSHGLTDEMLKKGNDLNLIEFLIQKSKEYKTLKKD